MDDRKAMILWLTISGVNMFALPFAVARLAP